MTPREAEVACENYWKKKGAVETRRPVRTKFQKVDFLGADVLAVMHGGSKMWSQVTTAKLQNHIRERRRKLEKIPWSGDDYVYVFQVVERPSVAHAGRTEYFFRVHDYDHDYDEWKVWGEGIPITREMRKVGKKAEATK